jgi:WD40 repeat protein
MRPDPRQGVPAASSAQAIDVFLSYNRRDTHEAEQLAHALRARDVRVFFDRWSLAPGEPWASALESALGASPAVIVVLGPNGLSDWQRAESELALDRQRSGEAVVVIPVLIQGADPPLGFLRLNTWVDFRAGIQPVGLERLAGLIRGDAVSAALSICPYRGLRPFRQEDAEFFFGREEFVARAVAAVADRSLVGVVGASGAGKSSAVRAGLLPALQRDDGSEPWRFVVVVPGARPLHALAASVHALLERGVREVERLDEIGALAERLLDGRLSLRELTDRLASERGGRILLVVDQFEELYTHGADERARDRFLSELLATTADGGVRAVLTVRADFFDDVLGDRAFADRLDGGVVSLAPMNRDELQRCIEEPARRVGLSFESGLVERILADVTYSPGSLPLLEFVLTELWQQRRGAALIHAAYSRMGGVQGAIARRADEEYERRDDAGRRALRRVMLKLVHTAPGVADTRRRATRGEIGEASWPLVLQLADARLLVTARDDATDEDIVDVAHEALIHHWQRLREWLNADREFLLWRRRLAAALEQHAALPPDRGGLLRGGILAEALRWRAARVADLSDAERTFIAASDRDARRARMRRRLNAAALGVTAVAMLALGAWNVQGRQAARAQRAARILSAAAEQTDPLVAALLVRALPVRTEPAGGARLARQIADRPVPLAVLDRGSDGLRAAAIAPDAAYVLTGHDDGTVLLWPADARGQPRRLGSVPGGVSGVSFGGAGGGVAFSADGTLALAFSGEAIRVWRVRDGIEVALQLDAGATPAAIAHATFAARGTRLIATLQDGTIRMLALDGTAPGTVLRTRTGAALGAVASADGRRIAAIVDRVVELFDTGGAADPLVLAGHTGPIVTAAFDAAGERLLTASHDGTVRSWDVTTGAGSTILSSADSSAAWSAAFDGDGGIVASFGDGLVRALRAGSTAVETYPGHAGNVRMVQFSPDGRRIASAGSDRTARMWRAGHPASAMTLAGHGAEIFALAFSADGARVITASHDGTVRVWPGTGRGDPLVLEATGPAFAGTIAADGARIALGGDDGVTWLWQADGSGATSLRGHQRGVRTVAFDPAGARVVTASWDSTARVWTAGGEPLAVLRATAGVAAARFGPDGAGIVTAADDGTVTVWSGPDFSRRNAVPAHGDLVHDAGFSPDGALVASAAADGSVTLWRVDEGIRTPLRGHDAAVRTVAFAQDGSVLATASEDGTAILWSPASGDTVRVLRGHEGWLRSARFDARGRRLVSASDDGTARVWSVDGIAEPVLLRGHAGGLLGARFSHDGDYVATAGTDRTARIYPLDHRAEPVVLRHDGVVRDAVFTPDDDSLVTFGEDGVASVWRVGWRALHAYLTSATAMCLTAEQRTRLLAEDAARAQREASSCERRHGRE